MAKKKYPNPFDRGGILPPGIRLTPAEMTALLRSQEKEQPMQDDLARARMTDGVFEAEALVPKTAGAVVNTRRREVLRIDRLPDHTGVPYSLVMNERREWVKVYSPEMVAMVGSPHAETQP